MTSTTTAVPHVPTMRPLTIETIEVTAIVVPLAQEYRGSYYSMRNRSTIITRVVTREGIVGEAYAGDEDSTLAQIVSIVLDEIAPRLVGQDGFSIERCWELGYPVTYDQLRDRRVGLVALASVDLALWDAIGKAVGRPLWQLWGGYRDTIPVNIIGGYYGRDLHGIRDEVTDWRGRGFRGCKFKIGGQGPRVDAARVEVAREAGGDDFVITIDANQGYTRGSGDRLSASVLVIWTSGGSRSHASGVTTRATCATSARVAGFRSARGRASSRPRAAATSWSRGRSTSAISTPRGRVATPTGGAWPRPRISISVELAHHEEPQVAAHLLASQPHGTYVEVFHPDRDPIWWQMIANRPELQDGKVSAFQPSRDLAGSSTATSSSATA